MSSIDPSVVATIVATAESLGVDPLTAISDALHEGGLGSTAVIGDQGTSVGWFQLHWGGELNALGPTFAQASAAASDPAVNARTALGHFAAVQAADPYLDPGQLAAKAEGPRYPGPYAVAVDTTYSSLKSTAGEPPAVSSGSWTDWLKKIAEAAGGAIAGPAGAAAGSAAGSVASGAAGLVTGSWGADALKIGLTLTFVIGGLALILLGLGRMFPGVTREVVSGARDTAKGAAVAAAA